MTTPACPDCARRALLRRLAAEARAMAAAGHRERMRENYERARAAGRRRYGMT